MTDNGCQPLPYGHQFGGDPIRASRAALAELDYHHPWLAEQIAGYGPVGALTRLVERFPTEDLLQVLPDDAINGVGLRERAATAIHRSAENGSHILIPEEDQWPTRLPGMGITGLVAREGLLCLWVRSEAPRSLRDILDRSVAVVGARAATEYGVHVAEQLGYDLAQDGWTVAATGQFGIDAAALRGALAAGGTALAVLSSGLDQPYPPGNADLLRQVSRNGMVISEWPLGTPPSRPRFTATAGLVAAATAGTVLVEASTRSRALVTVQRAINLGRPVMVVPGPVTSALSAGTHQVLREYPQARLVRGSADVLGCLAGRGRPSSQGS